MGPLSGNDWAAAAVADRSTLDSAPRSPSPPGEVPRNDNPTAGSSPSRVRVLRLPKA
ncbi:hypothetical protein GCM10027184_17030 [Saccharothrix stipae]